MGASPSVTACSLTYLLFRGTERDSVSGDVHGNFAACLLIQDGVRAPNRDQSSLAAT
jgi:hypothetical protein